MTAKGTTGSRKELPQSLEDSVREDLAKNLKERNMQFRYKTVENVMAPLIHQVTSLTEFDPMSLSKDETERFLLHQRQFGSPHKLVQLVDKAVMNFVVVGEDIAAENPEFQEDMLLACEEVRTRGELLHTTGGTFVQDSSNSNKRATMVRAARELLFSITRLMVIADIVDVNNLLNASNRIEEKLRGLLDAKSEGDVMDVLQDCATNISHVVQTATLRLNETKSKTSLQMLSTVQTELNQASLMFVSASKAFLHNPTVKAAEENREMIIEGMLKSLKTLSLLADGDDDSLCVGDEVGWTQPGEVVTSFSNFESTLGVAVPGEPISSQAAASLQKELGVVLKAAADLASSSCTRDSRQHTVISQSSSLKASLQGLVSGGEGERRREGLEQTRRHSTTLKQELHRVSVDHLSDAFVDVFSPLNSLVKVAQEGDRGKIEEVAEHFQQHVHTMLKAAAILCSLSKDTEGIQMVKMAAKNVKTLAPQVVNAAETLIVQPRSSVLQKNMSVFRDGWVENVSLLTSSMDAIAPLLDFLVVTEAHLHEDSQVLLESVITRERGIFEQVVHLMEGRCSRAAHILKTEMKENPTAYSDGRRERIRAKVREMETKSLVMFRDSAFKTREGFNQIHGEPECLRELQDTTRKVMEDIQELCREVLATRSPTEQHRVQLDLEEMLHPPQPPMTPTPSSQVSVSSAASLDSSALSTPRRFQRTPTHSQVFDTKDSAKSVMTQLSVEQQAQLAKVTAGFTAQQAEFESEAKRWDGENDIVLLAKEMCMMMMDMSDFTRGIGHLHSVLDLVITAKDIARAGEALCALTGAVANQCPDAKSRSDLCAYIDRIKLHCHQLKITSKVKQTSTRDTVDSASALMTAAKNLMTVVVHTVKTCYIASVAIARAHGGSMPDQFTLWRLTLPRMKSLESSSTPEARKDTLIQQLGQFKPDRFKKPVL